MRVGMGGSKNILSPLWGEGTGFPLKFNNL